MSQVKDRDDGPVMPKAVNRALAVVVSSVNALAGGTTEGVSVSGTSAKSAAISGGSALVYPTTDVFFRQGALATVTAVLPVAETSLGDQILPSGAVYRVDGITEGNALAFITSGATGTVWVTPLG